MGRVLNMMKDRGLYKAPVPQIKLNLPDKLFPYQKEGVRRLVELDGRALLADEMGLGKSCQILTYLSINPDIRPALIFCPASLKLNWAKECFKWLDTDERCNAVYILSGRGNKTVERVRMVRGQLELTEISKLPKTGIVIVNYDVLANEFEKKIDEQTGDKIKIELKGTAWIDELINYPFKILVPDEAHKLNNTKSNRTKAFKKLMKKKTRFIPTTGTPLNKPMELFPVLNALAPDLFPDYWKFGMRYCNPKNNAFTTTFKGASNTKELHTKLQNIMIRRLKADVLPELPPKIRTIVPVPLNNRKEYRSAEQDIVAYLEQLDPKQAMKAMNAVGFAKMAKLQELALKGKIDSCVEWIEDFLESGEKLVVFCTHNPAVDALQKAFKKISVTVNGKVTGKARNEAVEAFQNDPKVRLFIGNIDAAGVGLTLTAASNVAFLELPWSPNDVEQAIDRCHRIGATAECINVYFLLASNTIDEDLGEIIDEKLTNIKRIMDGKEVKESEMIGELFKRVQYRKVV